jgi:hypothetical protein
MFRETLVDILKSGAVRYGTVLLLAYREDEGKTGNVSTVANPVYPHPAPSCHVSVKIDIGNCFAINQSINHEEEIICRDFQPGCNHFRPAGGGGGGKKKIIIKNFKIKI